MPNAQQAPRCSQVGILGPVTGVIGAIQALETIKLCLGLGTDLTGKLFLFDGRDMRTMEIATAKNPDCPCCAK
jgi:molybdopterin/thiamine biosynthesis adenylyltransferase